MEEEILTAPQESVPASEQLFEVVDVQFRPGQKVYFFDPAGGTYHIGDHLIIETARGPEYGICAGGNHMIPAKDVVAPLRSVIRTATPADERIVQENRAKEKYAYEVCLQKIADHQLDMQLVSAEYAFDGSKVLFFFTADERVDFRELVKNLASTFHTRIELRQIGVRDKAKMVGGLGICGRPFCCASFLDDFQPVSIKMAKTQNLSLNPTKISGTCGRLMCCLKYEQDTYEDLLRTSPKAESFVDTPEGRGTVVEVDLLRQRVKVRMEDAPETIGIFPNEDIAILRNGKAKKNDPPIPADLAPISGNGKRERPQPQEESPMVLETIRFRYSTEQIVEDPVPEATEEPIQAAETAEEPSQKSGKPRRSRNRSKSRPQGEKAAPKEEQAQPAKPEKQPKPEKQQPKQEKPAPKADAAPKMEGEACEDDQAQAKSNKPHHRRNNYHRRNRKPRPQGEGGGSQE